MLRPLYDATAAAGSFPSREVESSGVGSRLVKIRRRRVEERRIILD
jgi:hypothetical protein